MDKLEKKYYKIREVAEMLGLPPSTLRFWESKFTIIKPKRNNGLKIEAAQEQIRHNHSNVSRRSQAIERLRSIRATLQSLLDATRSLR